MTKLSNQPTNGVALARKAVASWFNADKTQALALQRIACGIMLAYDGADIIVTQDDNTPIIVTLGQCVGTDDTAKLKRSQLGKACVKAIIGDKPEFEGSTDATASKVTAWARKAAAIKRALHFTAILRGNHEVHTDAFNDKNGWQVPLAAVLKPGMTAVTANDAGVYLNGRTINVTFTDKQGNERIKGLRLSVDAVLASVGASKRDKDAATTLSYNDLVKRSPTIGVTLQALVKQLDDMQKDHEQDGVAFVFGQLTDDEQDAFDGVFAHLSRIMMQADHLTDDTYAVITAPRTDKVGATS